MKDRKITAALIQLSVYELNSFNKYVNSPYFNVNESISKYLELILDWIKKGNTNDDIPNEELWNKVYGDVAYQNQKFLKLNSDLVKLLEDFLAQQEYDHMLSLRTNLKLEGVRKRGIEKLYNGIIGELERLEKMEVNQSVEYYYTKYQIERGLFNLKTENEKKMPNLKYKQNLT